jgi:hypothetical protein
MKMSHIKRIVCGWFRHPWGEWIQQSVYFDIRRCARCDAAQARFRDTPEAQEAMDVSGLFLPLFERLAPEAARLIRQVIRATKDA